MVDNVENKDAPILYQQDDGVAILTMNRGKMINALSEDMLTALSHHLDKIAAISEIKAVILRSNSAHFCAGHNLKK